MEGNRKYLDIFLKEADEHLNALQQGLLVLEKTPGDRELIHGLLRNAHTLKGSARMLGYDSISSIAHRMEDLLKDVEDGVRQAESFLIDRLFCGADAITHLTAAMAKGEEPPFELEPFLEAFDRGEVPAAGSPQVMVQASEAIDTVRAKVTTLDSLVNLVGEMMINQKRFEQQLALLRSLCRVWTDGVPTAAVAEFGRDLEREVASLSSLIREVHGEAMALRMLPLKTVTDGLERMVRDVAGSLGKQVVLEVSGETIEVDRVLLETLKPAFIHLVTNAVDHGIEMPADRIAAGKPATGKVQISARYEGNRVRVEIRDDGRGIDPRLMVETAVRKGIMSREEADVLSDDEALYLVFRPGFSTSHFVTDLSGRGVGMDVVQRNVEKVKGNLTITSRLGIETEISLQLPLTLSIMDALIISCAGEVMAIPLAYVVETFRVRSEDIGSAEAREVITIRGNVVPLASLATLLGFTEKSLPETGELLIVLLKLRDQCIACSIEGNLGSAEIVVKGLGEQLKMVEGISGATILGDGSPALILNVPDLFASAETSSSTSFRDGFARRVAHRKKGRILIVDDSITTRTMERSILAAQGYDVDLAVSGEDAMVKVASATYDLVVSDIEMPGIDGFAFTENLRSMDAYREVPVIIVSSRSRDEDKRRALEAGAQAYIVKGSFEQGLLLDTVEALIG